MVSQESLQSYAEKAFSNLPCSVQASRNLNNGKFLLLVSVSDTDQHRLNLDENDLNSDMESAVRTLRDRLYPPVVTEAEVTLESVVPPTDPAPPPEPEPSPEPSPDPFPAAEVTRPSMPPKSKR